MVKEKLAIVEFPNLNHRQAFAIDFAIEVEGKDIGHARKVVKDSHDAHVGVGVVDIVLAGHAVE